MLSSKILELKATKKSILIDKEKLKKIVNNEINFKRFKL